MTLGNTNKAKRKAEIQRAAPQGNDRTEMKGEASDNLQKVAETKNSFDVEREKGGSGKRLILSKLKEMKKEEAGEAFGWEFVEGTQGQPENVGR